MNEVIRRMRTEYILLRKVIDWRGGRVRVLLLCCVVRGRESEREGDVVLELPRYVTLPKNQSAMRALRHTYHGPIRMEGVTSHFPPPITFENPKLILLWCRGRTQRQS